MLRLFIYLFIFIVYLNRHFITPNFLVSTIREFCNAFEVNCFVITIVVYLLFLFLFLVKAPQGRRQ